jgi:hypothetical protein
MSGENHSLASNAPGLALTALAIVVDQLPEQAFHTTCVSSRELVP